MTDSSHRPALEVLTSHWLTMLGAALVTTASLGFLGLGAQTPTPEWGTMIGAGRQYFLSAWWYSAFPGLAIFVVVLLFTILSERLPSYLS